jgi:hypothetical protein
MASIWIYLWALLLVLAFAGVALAGSRPGLAHLLRPSKAIDSIVSVPGFVKRRDRMLNDARIAFFSAKSGVEIEIVESPFGSGLRLFLSFQSSYDWGIRIVSEKHEGVLSRWHRLIETEVGDPSFDPLFFVLTQDDDRTALIDGQVKLLLISLHGEVDDIQVSQAGVFVYRSVVPDIETIQSIVVRMVALSEHLRRGMEDIESRELLETEEFKRESIFEPGIATSAASQENPAKA